MTPYDPTFMPRLSLNDIARESAPQMANPLAPQGPSPFHALMGSLSNAYQKGQQQNQQPGGFGNPPPAQGLAMAPSAGVQQAQMDPGQMQSLLQMYGNNLQPSGQLAAQMQAARVPGLLSRF